MKLKFKINKTDKILDWPRKRKKNEKNQITEIKTKEGISLPTPQKLKGW